MLAILRIRFHSLSRRSTRRLTRRSSSTPRAGQSFEALETRLAFSTLAGSPFIPAHALSPAPTVLAVNFDGGAFFGKYAVTPYSGGSASQIDMAIQDTLFRVAEIYAPFDVQVYRQPGNNAFVPGNGATTVFVGASYGLQPVNVGTTPLECTDYPRDGFLTHTRNSDPFDVAFVSPASATGMAVGIAHEAAHTFGLWHVRTDGQVDPFPLQSLPANAPIDVMSYNRPSGLLAFSLEELPVTIFNNTANGLALEPALQPEWDDGSSVTRVAFMQNSYICLGQVLGPRSADGSHHVADTATISQQFVYGSSFVPFQDTVTTGDDGKALVAGKIDRRGDYEVYRWTSHYDQIITVSTAAVGGGLDPLLMVYDDAGRDSRTTPNNLLYIDDAAGKRLATASTVALKPGQLLVKAGQTLNFVVGARDGATTGSYRFQLQEDVRVRSIAISRIGVREHFTLGTAAQQATITTTASVTLLKAPAGATVKPLPGGSAFQIDYRGSAIDAVSFEIDVTRKATPRKVIASSVKSVMPGGAFGRPVLQVGYADGTIGTLAASQGFWTVRFTDGSTQTTDVAASVKYNAIPLAKLTRVITPPAGIPLGTVRNVYLQDLAATPNVSRSLSATTSDGATFSRVYTQPQSFTVVLRGAKPNVPDLDFLMLSK